MKKLISIVSLLVVTCALVACGGGGGGSSSICGASSQTFGVSFGTTTVVSLKVGTQSTISTTITPESCRMDMSFAVTDGTILEGTGVLPPGMSLVNGNVVGTPTTAGSYKFAIQIRSVNNYKAFTVGSYPHSAQITVNVGP